MLAKPLGALGFCFWRLPESSFAAALQGFVDARAASESLQAAGPERLHLPELHLRRRSVGNGGWGEVGNG